MKFIILLIASLISIQAYAGSGCETMVPFGKPVVTTTEKVTYLCRKMYVLEHSPSRHTPYWSAEHLLGVNENTAADRINAFKADPDLPKNEAAKPGDYAKTGYDIGHMSPVGDMHSDPKAMLESFYLSNMSPQIPGNNRVGWRMLEVFVRKMSIARKDIFVITGPIYVGNKFKTIGGSKVMVPTHFYKILYDAHSKTALTFMVPNVPFTQRDLPKYITTLKTVEDATHVDFFPGYSPAESTHMWVGTTN